MRIVSAVLMAVQPKPGDAAGEHAHGELEILHPHRLVGIVAAVLVAHEDHRGRDAGAGKGRGVVAGTARHLECGMASSAAAARETVEQIGAHRRRFAAGERAELEPHAIFAADLVRQRVHARP